MPPIVNLEEEFGKVVGRRASRTVDYDRLVAMGGAEMQRLPFPKGVFRFRTHEEANAWTNHYIIQGALKIARDYREGQT